MSRITDNPVLLGHLLRTGRSDRAAHILTRLDDDAVRSLLSRLDREERRLVAQLLAASRTPRHRLSAAFRLRRLFA